MSDANLEALVRVFREAPRQGPSDPAVVDRLLDLLRLPARPRLADLGCGNGATAVRLAQARGAHVIAVDAMATFVEDLRTRIAATPPAPGSVEPLVGDLLAPPIETASLDGVLCEGAAYNVGLANALEAFRPLLRPDGAVLVSECVWTTSAPPAEAREWWREEGVELAGLSDALRQVERSGWRFVAAEALEARAWRESYYGPLEKHLERLECEGVDAPVASVIAELRRESRVFQEYGASYTYVYLALRCDG